MQTGGLIRLDVRQIKFTAQFDAFVLISINFSLFHLSWTFYYLGLKPCLRNVGAAIVEVYPRCRMRNSVFDARNWSLLVAYVHDASVTCLSVYMSENVGKGKKEPNCSSNFLDPLAGMITNPDPVSLAMSKEPRQPRRPWDTLNSILIWVQHKTLVVTQ